MQTYKFSELTWESLNSLTRLQTVDTISKRWNQEQIELTAQEMQRIAFLKETLSQTSLMNLNEATTWARAIYPLLMMAERSGLRALSQVEMTAQFRNFLLTGTADGLLARIVLGEIAGPFLLVAEAKKGIDAKNPIYQLLGGMLAAAWLNYQSDRREPQEIYGCYTIAGTWTFLYGQVEEIEAEMPVMTVESSSEFSEKAETESILRILKFIAAKYSPAEAIATTSGF